MIAKGYVWNALMRRIVDEWGAVSPHDPTSGMRYLRDKTSPPLALRQRPQRRGGRT